MKKRACKKGGSYVPWEKGIDTSGHRALASVFHDPLGSRADHRESRRHEQSRYQYSNPESAGDQSARRDQSKRACPAADAEFDESLYKSKPELDAPEPESEYGSEYKSQHNSHCA